MAAMNALLLGTLMYKSGLVPRVIPAMGLVGAPLLLGVTIATMLGLTEHGSSWWLVVAPIFFWELSLGIYLVVRGFKPSPITAHLAPVEVTVEVPVEIEECQRMITVDRVTRTYGSFTAVDDVSFTAEPGRVTGFLGPNGAGKSTTMRIIVGLTSPSTGHATVAGRNYVDLPNPGLEVGVLLDASAQHAGRTGREILRIAQRFMGLPRSRVDEMLELVSLTPPRRRGGSVTTRWGCGNVSGSRPL